MKPSSKRSLITIISAAIICLGSFISSGAGTIPFTVQNFLVILISCILGGTNGMGAAGIFIVLGTLGLPVFALNNGGLEYLTGNTGGYIAGYFIASIVTGLISHTPFTFERHFNWKYYIRLITACFSGYAIILFSGLFWYMHLINETSTITFAKAFSECVTPFIFADLGKFAVTVPLAVILRPVFAKIMYPDNEF